MTRYERNRAVAHDRAIGYFNRLPRPRRGLPMRFDLLPGGAPRGPLSAVEWESYGLHRQHHHTAHSDYDARSRRPQSNVALAIARRLKLPIGDFVAKGEWLRSDERAALLLTSAQAAIVVLSAGIAVGRRPYVVWRGDDDRPRPRPVWLTRNRVFEVLAGGWSDHWRVSPASRVEDLRSDTLSAIRRDLVRNGLVFKALWNLALDNPLYSTHRSKAPDGVLVGGYTVTFKDEAAVSALVAELEDSGFRLHEAGRRLRLAEDRPIEVEARLPRQEMAAEWPYNVVTVSPRSHDVIRILEGSRMRLDVKRFTDDIAQFTADANRRAKRIQRVYGFDPYKIRSRSDREDVLDRLDVKQRRQAERDLDAFDAAATPATQWATAAEQLVGVSEVVTIRSAFERVINRRWEAVDLWPGDVPEQYRGRWFTASDGSPLYGLDVSASQTQLLSVFLGLRDLEARAASLKPRFNAGLAERAWSEHRHRLNAGYPGNPSYTGPDDPRLVALLKKAWMVALYGGSSIKTAKLQREEPRKYGPGWVGESDPKRGYQVRAFLKSVPRFAAVSRFLSMSREVAWRAYQQDPAAGVTFVDPLDGAAFRWHPIARVPKVNDGLMLTLPAYQRWALNERGVPEPIRDLELATPDAAGYPVDLVEIRRMVAPCLTHTLDAFFAALVVEGLARAGVHDVVSVHDAWLVPEAHADTLARVVEESARPWLEGLGPVYDALIGYLDGTQFEAEVRAMKAAWMARVARGDYPRFAVKQANLLGD